MNKQIFKLSLEEKDYIDRISGILGYDKNVVKDVFQTFLNLVTIELYSGSNTIYIPYVCSLEVDSHEKLGKAGVQTVVELQAQPMQSLIDEVKAVSEGDITPTRLYMRKQIMDELNEDINT